MKVLLMEKLQRQKQAKIRANNKMLFIYTIGYFIGFLFYHYGFNMIASGVIISLAIFLYYLEYRKKKRIINVNGLFALGFIGGFGLSLLKLSKLSSEYNIITFIAVYISYFALYLGDFVSTKKKKIISIDVSDVEKKENELYDDRKAERLIVILIVVTLISFLIEVMILKFVPLFTINTPHAYSTFHVFMLHYITTFYVFIPSFAVCNFFMAHDKKRAIIFIIISYVYIVIMALLLVSRAQLITGVVLSIFVVIICSADSKIILSELFKKNKKASVFLVISVVLFIILYIVITINRAHDVKYLNGIFEMKNENLPIFIAQPYMYIAHNFENLNYMINTIFRFTCGRRILIPFFTLAFIKKFFPIVVDSPTYVIKEELSTKTLIYDFYYDFGLCGIIFFMFIIGFVGNMIEEKTYEVINGFKKNNYIVVLFSLFCYYMIFSFFQTYFSLTDTWVNLIIVTAIIMLWDCKKVEQVV